MPGKLITLPFFRKPYQKLSDEELIELFKREGDKEIIGEFFNRYVHLIYSVCFSYYKDGEKTRDIVMEIFESLDGKIKKYEIQNFKAWLYQVSRNACLMDLRKKINEISLTQIENRQPIVVESEPILHPEKEDTKRVQSLHTFLESLKEGQRICIELMYFKDMSYKDISSITGFSLKQVKSYIQNGKRNLRGLLDNELFE